MPGLDCAFREFVETTRILNAIIDKHRQFEEYKLIIYCLEKIINVKKEKKNFLIFVLNMV